MIAVLEGIDASGKQTQAASLKTALSLTNRFAEIEIFDFPHYQGVAGGLVGRVLRGETIVADNDQAVSALRGCTSSGLDLPRLHLEKLMAGWSRDKALLIQCAMTIDRLEHVPLLRRFAGVPTRLLILDRYFLSGIVYGQADGLDRGWLEAIHSVLPKPDIFFVLDIPVEESVRRRPDRQDYYEKSLPKQQRVRELYLEECAAGRARLVYGRGDPATITGILEGAVLLKQRSYGHSTARSTSTLDEYRRQATEMTTALVELGHVDIVDRIIAASE